MIKEMFLASYGYFGGSEYFGGSDIGDMLTLWEQYGFFSYALPFLLIFALVFAILSAVKVFEKNKGVSAIIAFVIGLMSLQFGMVPRFFAEIFPKVGVGLVVILIIMIFLGIFMPKQNWLTYTMLGIGGLIVLIILITTAGDVGWSSGYWWTQNWPMIAGAVFILVALGIIVGTANSKPNTPIAETPLFKSMFGGS